MLHEFKMKSHDNAMFADVFVDGEKINAVRGVELEQFAPEFPTVILHLSAIPNIETFANVLYVADEESVEAATKYLRESVEKDEALRDEFKSRILSAIDGNTDCFESEKLADKILDVIFRD